MDHYSILDQSPPAIAPPGVLSKSASGPSVSSQIANANAHLKDLPKKDLPKTIPPEGNPSIAVPRFPGEDSGQSLAEFARADLDAALQLLADRALYITGASGAAIALRRGDHNDMLCRASVGVNAPELGALLSMEYGLSGESVRTRMPLRCDDAERDPRVNRQACRDLGIASVVVMPIVSDDRVFGVFELLSGKVGAFGERDLSALLRLSQMVEIAFRQSTMPTDEAVAPVVSVVDASKPENAPSSSSAFKAAASVAAIPQPALPANQEIVSAAVKPALPAPVAKKPLFWSAAARTQSTPSSQEDANSSAAPPALRGLQKCQACGFPVSRGRTLCVECEEKQWRGQRSAQSSAAQTRNQPAAAKAEAATPKSSPLSAPVGVPVKDIQEKYSPAKEARSTNAPEKDLQGTFIADSTPSALSVPSAAASPQVASPLIESPSIQMVDPQTAESSPAPRRELNDPAPFLSSAFPAESWLSANKYILAALLLVAAIVGAVVWLR